LSDELDKTHDWLRMVGGEADVDTCLKCGLLRLTTLSGQFYFTQISGEVTRCKWRAGETG